MSGIVGIYYLDGRPVDSPDLGRMVDILAHRGPDRADTWHEGSIGLGHRMLWTTPESLNEKLPLINPSGDVVITADARIDNRDELLPILGFADRPAGEVADSQLILAAYEKWGKGCPERLIGDFSFAIWDNSKHELFCARDHFGIKPFYYYLSNKIFVFASEIKALFCLPEIPCQLNEARVGDYLASMLDDTSVTFYRNILRLPPAYNITLNFTKGACLKSYWALDPSREIQLKSNEAYAEAFREHFVEAVRCRLRSAVPVGSLLSGGLDSSSISCVARNLRAKNGEGQLPTVSAVFDEGSQCDERSFINSVLAQNGFKPHYLYADQLDPFVDFDRMLWHQDEPIYATNLFMTWGLASTAKKNDIRILMDGFDGDNVVSLGFGYLKELAYQGRWLALALNVWRLSYLYDSPAGISSWEAIRRYIWRYSLKPRLSRFNGLKQLRRNLRSTPQRAQTGPNLPYGRSAFLNPDFAQRINIVGRYQANLQPYSAQTERERHYLALAHGRNSSGLEVLDKTAAAFSIETRYPFWDKRLVEFCLALPPEQKLYNGWSRMVMRRAMNNILPQKVQWRRSKTDFSSNVSQGLLTSHKREHLDELILEDSGIIQHYVNVSNLRDKYSQFIAQTLLHKQVDVFEIWLAVSLALWLRNTRVVP